MYIISGGTEKVIVHVQQGLGAIDNNVLPIMKRRVIVKFTFGQSSARTSTLKPRYDQLNESASNNYEYLTDLKYQSARTSYKYILILITNISKFPLRSL